MADAPHGRASWPTGSRSSWPRPSRCGSRTRGSGFVTDHRRPGHRRPARGDGLLHGARRRGRSAPTPPPRWRVAQGRAARRGRPADRRALHAVAHASSPTPCRRPPSTSRSCSPKAPRPDAEVLTAPPPRRPVRGRAPTPTARRADRGRRRGPDDQHRAGRRAGRRQAGRADLARRRRADPPARRHPPGRPRRHARPDGHRGAGARHRAGHPAARPPCADGQDLRRDDPARRQRR